MSKIWTLLTCFILGHIIIWIQAPRLEFPKVLANSIETSRLFEFINLTDILQALSNSILIALLTILLSLLFTIPTALVISRSKSIFLKNLSLLLYLPLLAPLLIPSFGLYNLFLAYDLTGSILSIALAQSCVLYPYMLKPIEDYLSTEGDKWERVSYSLGANRIETFFKITLKSLKKPLFIGSFFIFIGSFNDYIISFLIGDLRIKTLSVYLYPLMQSDNRMTSVFIIILYALPLILISFLISFVFKRAHHVKS
jgi:ABC-type spermidine/putrescine transport system permease subunit II